MDTNKKMRDYISAFADGELPDADLELALASLREADGRHAWELYHRIGDVLRATDPPPPELSPGFAARLADKLAAEPMPVRRGAGQPALAAEALGAVVQSVAISAENVNGSALAGQAVAPHEATLPDGGVAAVKRL